MKSDEELMACVVAELKRDPHLAHAEIGVIVKDSVVTVTGHVDTVEQKDAVERAVRRVCGVSAAAFELDARTALGHKHSDSEIAHAAVAALRANPLLSRARVNVEVDHGWVTLSGEVESDPEAEMARRCIAGLPGVRGSVNCISIRGVHDGDDPT